MNSDLQDNLAEIALNLNINWGELHYMNLHIYVFYFSIYILKFLNKFPNTNAACILLDSFRSYAFFFLIHKAYFLKNVFCLLPKNRNAIDF